MQLLIGIKNATMNNHCGVFVEPVSLIEPIDKLFRFICEIGDGKKQLNWNCNALEGNDLNKIIASYT